MSPDDIEGALNAQLATLTGVLIAWENSGFNPGNVPWIRPTYMPGIPTEETVLAANIQLLHVGVFQISILIPLGIGDGPARALALQVEALFPVGSSLLRNGTPVRITKSYRLPATRDEHYFHLPVRVEWWTEI